MLAGYLGLLRRERSLILFGALVALLSSPGQTFLIGLFVGSFAASFGLSAAALGSLYSGATLAAAILYLLVGHWIDRVDLRLFTATVMIGLATACLLTASAVGPASLFLGLLLLRLMGQGLMSHIAATSMARHFGENRGQALSLSASGFAAGEAILPAIIVSAILLIGWRQSYLAIAIFLVVVCLPTLLKLIWSRPDFYRPTATGQIVAGWRWLEGIRIVTRTRFFWMFLPLIMTSPLVTTGLIFHIEAVSLANNSSLEVAATAFTAYAMSHAVALFCTGPLIDRCTARTVTPLAIVPLLAGVGFTVSVQHWSALYVLMASMGMTAAVTGTSNGALWAEVYGVSRIGSIRSVAIMLMLAGTAGGPVVLGALMEAGVALDSIMTACVVFGMTAMLLAAAAPSRCSIAGP